MLKTLFQKVAEGQRNLAFEAEELETEKDNSAGQVRLILLLCLLAVKRLLRPVPKLKFLSDSTTLKLFYHETTLSIDTY